jgi:hypothetical protein
MKKYLFPSILFSFMLAGCRFDVDFASTLEVVNTTTMVQEVYEGSDITSNYLGVVNSSETRSFNVELGANRTKSDAKFTTHQAGCEMPDSSCSIVFTVTLRENETSTIRIQ